MLKEMMLVDDRLTSVQMQMNAETEADQCCLAHPRMYPVTLSVMVASLREAKQLLTPSLSELSALEDIGPLSAIVID